MHLEQLPSGSWRVTVSHQGMRRRGTQPTKNAARRHGAQLLLEMGARPTKVPRSARADHQWLADLERLHGDTGAKAALDEIDRLRASNLRLIQQLNRQRRNGGGS